MAAKKNTAIPADMKQYFNSYPGHNRFYRTSDGQVFLEENPATIHQTGRLKKDAKEIEVFERGVEKTDEKEQKND